MAGRKRTCLKKVPFNRRINVNILNILRDYAKRHNLTDTQALESAILLQSNIEKLKGDMVMKICIPTSEGKLCGHFGHCDSFTFAEINPETHEIISIEEKVPEDDSSSLKNLTSKSSEPSFFDLFFSLLFFLLFLSIDGTADQPIFIYFHLKIKFNIFYIKLMKVENIIIIFVN